jgi:hypothetical protein
MCISLFAIVPCANGAVRLDGGSFSYEGRFDVCVNETWGTICTDFWDTNDTAVACRQLGFPAAGMTFYNASKTTQSCPESGLLINL